MSTTPGRFTVKININWQRKRDSSFAFFAFFCFQVVLSRCMQSSSLLLQHYNHLTEPAGLTRAKDGQDEETG